MCWFSQSILGLRPSSSKPIPLHAPAFLPILYSVELTASSNYGQINVGTCLLAAFPHSGGQFYVVKRTVYCGDHYFWGYLEPGWQRTGTQQAIPLIEKNINAHSFSWTVMKWFSQFITERKMKSNITLSSKAISFNQYCILYAYVYLKRSIILSLIKLEPMNGHLNQLQMCSSVF